eukprot:2792500-Prymnesium_polylepis.1
MRPRPVNAYGIDPSNRGHHPARPVHVCKCEEDPEIAGVDVNAHIIDAVFDTVPPEHRYDRLRGHPLNPQVGDSIKTLFISIKAHT